MPHSPYRELVSLARSKGVFLMEALWSRFLPPHVKLREVIASGDLGAVTHVDATLGLQIGAPRLFKKDLGGGSMLDLGVYATFMVRNQLLSLEGSDFKYLFDKCRRQLSCSTVLM